VRRQQAIGAATWPMATQAQQPDRMRRIGVLEGFAEGNREGQLRSAAFRERLTQLGWVEDRNLRTDIRWAPPGMRRRQGLIRKSSGCLRCRIHLFTAVADIGNKD